MLAHLLWSLPSVWAYLLVCRGSGVAKNQPKALIPKNKNHIFQKFLSSFPKTSYERRATRNGYIFVSNVQVALIIEGVFFCSLSLPEFIPGCTYTALLPGNVSSLALEFNLGVCLLACLPGVGGPPAKSSQLFTCL